MQKILITALLTLLGITANADVVEVAAGELKERLGGKASTVTALTLKGNADARDLHYLASLPALRTLDMCDLDIVAVESDTIVLPGRSLFPANTIPSFMFALSRLESVSLPASLTAIEECAFASSASLASVQTGASLREISDWAFYNTAIVSISLPSSVKTLGEGVFASCPSLTEAIMASSGLNELPAKTFRGCTSLKSITFPPGLSSIGAECMLGSGLESFSLPSSVKSTGEYAFSSMPELKEAFMGNASHSVGALYNNTQLRHVYDLTDYPALAVAHCPVLWMDSVTTWSMTRLGDYALADNGSTQLWLTHTLESVGSHVLDGMNSFVTIQGYSMGADIPETAAGAFDGLQQVSSVTLWVDENHDEVWRDHPEWGRFEIIPTADAVESIEADVTGGLLMDCVWVDHVLRLTASENITSVTVADASGAILAISSPRSVEAMIDMSGISANVIVVRAATASGTKSFKLRRTY